MRVLVTGGAGYIGSHTAKILARSGLEPVVLDNLSSGHRWAVQWGPLVPGDLADSASLCELMAAYEIQAVIHFAAHAYVGDSMRNPRQYFRNNVVNTLNLLDAMVEVKVEQIVFSSSCATYGIPQGIPISESHHQFPVSPYGESKLFAERALHWYAYAYGLRWMALRYFNAAGADPDGEIGEEHDPEPHLIPRVIQAALGQIPCVEIYGTDYPTPDGTAIRDYVHVTDLAEAHCLALSHILGDGNSTFLNLGTGAGHSVREVIGAVERVSGCRISVREAGRRPGDPPELVADPAKAKQLLGWQPQHSTLDAIVQTAWSWHAARTAVSGLVRPAGVIQQASESAGSRATGS
jgi:UDP-glucose-4-epimerase GalE